MSPFRLLPPVSVSQKLLSAHYEINTPVSPLSGVGVAPTDHLSTPEVMVNHTMLYENPAVVYLSQTVKTV